MDLGKPTEYNYALPRIRYNLSKKHLSKVKSRDRLLDYGCGNGANTVLFKDDFREIIGIEVERERINEARRHAKDKKIGNVRYLVYNGNKVPCKNKTVDACISFEVLEHTFNEKSSLKEIHRVLKKGGLFFISVPNKWYLMETHGFNLPWREHVPYHRIPLMSWLPKSFYRKFGRARIYTKKEITGLLTEAGFKTVDFSYIRPPFDKLKGKLAKQILTKVYGYAPEFMGVSIFIVCRK